MRTRKRQRAVMVSRTLLMVMLIGVLVGGLQLAYGQTCPPGPGPGSGQGMQVDNACMQEVAGFGLNCTANDVNLANATNITILDDGCAYPGDTVTFTATFEVNLTAQGRHDIGIYFATDGDPNVDGAITGQCNINTLAYYPDPPWLDLDLTNDPWPGENKASGCQDWCGDIDADHNPLYPVITLTTACIDPDGDGKLELPYCTSWRQPGDNDLCTSPLEAKPGAPSKCKCDIGFTVDIPVPPPALNVVKTVDADGDGAFSNSESIPEPGGSVVYKVVLTNPSPSFSANITILTDSIYGNITTTGHDGITDTTCSLPQTLTKNGGSYTCTFTVDVSGNPRTITDTVTASGVDENNRTVTGSDWAQVIVTPVAAPIQIIKTAVPNQVSELGANVTYGFVVRNLSTFETVTITSLMDTIYGDLTAYPGTTCAVPFILQPNDGDSVLPEPDTYSCEIKAFVSGNYGDMITNVATASGVDDDEAPVFDDDSATVTITDVPGAIEVIKDASPSSLNEPGGLVTFTITVINKSAVDTVTITSLTDDIHGNLNGKGDCTVPFTLQVGDGVAGGTDTYTCSFTADVTGDYGNSETDVVSAGGTDADGFPVFDDDPATVTIADVLPDISISKTANPTEVLETGENVTFTIVITNNSTVEAVTITSLVDDKFGDLNGQGSCAVPQTLAANGDSYTCTITKFLSSDSLTPHTNAVTAAVHDNDNNTYEVSDDETVNFEDVAPAIRITKTASPSLLPWDGADVTFTFLVENIGQEDVMLTSLTDTVFGDLNGQGTCSGPQTILIGGSYSCSFTVFLSSDHYNVVTATAVDDDNTPVTDTDDATVYQRTGALLPTQTTCDQYAAGPNAWPTMYESFLYQVDKKTSNILSVSPGVIYYYNTITAPDAEFNLTVSETNSLLWNAMLWQDAGQAILYTSDCSKASGVTVTATGTTSPYNIQFTVTGATPGATYYIGIKYSPANLAGQPVLKSGGVYPTNTYFFSTAINGGTDPGSATSINVAPK